MAGPSRESMDELLGKVLDRQEELITPDGLLGPQAFAVADILGTRFCVDGVPVRRNQQGNVELMAIRRATGPYAGKLCLVGGGVGRVREGDRWVPESVEGALRRHFRTDLGYDIEPVGSWDQPHYLAQDMRPIDGEVRPGFMPNPASRHLIAARYLVRLVNEDDGPVYGSTDLGGQEASGVQWFTQAEMPDLSEFGYNHGVTYEAMFGIADRLLNLAA